MAILPGLQGPADLRGLSDTQLLELAEEIRRTIISTVAVTGGQTAELNFNLSSKDRYGDEKPVLKGTEVAEKWEA